MQLERIYDSLTKEQRKRLDTIHELAQMTGRPSVAMFKDQYDKLAEKVRVVTKEKARPSEMSYRGITLTRHAE